MLKKLMGLIREYSKLENEENEVTQDIEFSIGYYITPDNTVLIDISAGTHDFDAGRLALLTHFIGSREGQLETVGVIIKELESASGGDTEQISDFRNKFVQLSKKEHVIFNEEGEEEPCIKPSDVL